MNSVDDISDNLKRKIFQLISTPGLEIKDISKKFNLEPNKIIELLTQEYCKYDLDQGRRICCRG